MAAQATRKISPGIIDASLRELQAEVADLPKRAAAWDAEPEVSRISFLIAWHELMNRLDKLNDAHRFGQMTATQREQYRLLCSARSEAAYHRTARSALPIALFGARPSRTRIAGMKRQ
jgi:hypothetical protein